MKKDVNVTIKTLRAYRLVANKSLAKEPTTTLKDSLTTYNFLKANVLDRKSLDVYESFYAVYLDQSLNVKGYIKVSSGGITHAIADPRIIFAVALKCLATAIVLCHNHPSGNPRPSEEDRKLTAKIVSAGKLLDIVITDHLVVTPDRYYSFRDNGLMTY